MRVTASKGLKNDTAPSLKRKLDYSEPAGATKRPAPASKPVKSVSRPKKTKARPKGKASEAEAPLSEDDISLDGGLDILEAVRKGMRSSTVRLETNLTDSSILGCSCSIYWPGDDEWYPGRILLVSTDGNKCFIFYDDSMTEWVDLNKSEVMIDAELGKVGNWAAYKVWVSQKAIDSKEAFVPLKTGKVYVYFLKEKISNHAYIKDSEFTSYYTPRTNDKALKNLALAMNEIEVKRQIIQDIVSVLRTYPLRRWSGEGLVGRTVVAPISEFMYCNPASLLGDSLGPGKRRRQTGVLTTANNMELPSQPMETDAIVLDSASTSICGIIRAYNPALDKFYISWGFVKVDSSEGHCKSVESMLALREEKGTIRFIPPWVGCSELPYDGRGDPLDVNIRAFLDLSLCFPDINYYTTFSKTSSVVDAAVAGTPELTMDDLKCSLCCESTIRFLNAPISEDCLRIVKDGDAFNQTYSSVFSLKECDLCHRKYHEGCMPEITSDVFDKSKKGPRLNQGNWCCWFCLECEECKASAWKSKLVRLNLTNLMISTGGTAKSLPISAAEKVVCIACADKYSELKREYCPICIKVYPSDEEVAIKVSTNGTVVASPVILPTVSLNFPIPAAPYIFPHLSDRKAVARMRYDGDCQSGTININAALPGHADLCSFTPENVLEDMQLLDDISDGMVECSECGRWVHARCESINKDAFEAIGNCSHPIWGGEYLCPKCRFNLCEKLLASLEERDIYGLFAEPVSDDVAPGYSEMIRNPMDLSTMRRKLLTGAYKSLHTLRQDFELVCDNAFRFNKHGDKYWKATLLFFLRGESVFSKSRVSSLSVYGENILKIVARDEINKTISNDLNKVVAAKPPKVGGAKDSDSGKDSQRPKNPKFASHVSIFEKNGYHMPSWLNQWLNETPKSAPLRRGDVVKFDAAPTGPVNEYARERGTSNRSSRYEAKALDCVAVAGEASQVDGIETATPSTIINDIETAAPVSLPKQLIVSAIDGAASYIRSNVLTLTPELAFYDCCRDKCLVCGCAEIENSSSDAATMIFCTGCGEGFHSFCIMPNRSSSTLLRSDWKCTNCSTCEICDDAYGASYSGYIYCDCCDRAYHLACVAPKLLAVPSGVWYCKQCVSCENCKSGLGPDYFINCDGPEGGADVCARGRIWGQSTNTCVVCSLSKSDFSCSLPKLPILGNVENCLSLSPECSVCGRDTAPNRGILIDQASLSHSDMRLRCTICLHYQHFFCSDSVSSAFYKNLYEASTLETDGSPMWKAAWEVALLQYFDAVQKDFTCANCVQLVAGRCAAKSTVASNSETSTLCLSQLCDEKKMVLISRLYKESIAPLERLIEVRAKRLSVVLICRVVLHQALWHHFELQNVFSLLDEDIVGAFRASRKLISNCGSNLDNILPYWMFLRSNRFLDVLHPDNTPRRPAAEHAFLGELHQLLQHLLRMEQNNVSESVQFLLDNENFDRIVQMASLASSFVSFIHLILRICGGSVAKDSVFTALHDKLICFSDNNRINIAQFFLRNEVESESLNAKVNATSGVGAAPSAGEGKLNVIWTAVNIPEAPPDEGQVNPSDQTIDIKRNVEQQSKQKRNESLVLPSHVGTFIKRILGRNLKGEKTVKKEESDSTPPPVPTGNSFGDDLNKGQSDTAPAIKTESVSLAAPAMATVAKQPHSEFIWSEGIINYMSYLSSCFDVGILMDCPENVAKLSYLCQRLYISTTSICAHFDFATYRLGEQYHKKVFDADIIKNNEERLKMVKSACAEDLSKNMLILSEIVTKCSAIPEPKPHSEKMELYFRIRGAEIKEFKRLTPLQSRMNKFILQCIRLFLIQPMGRPRADLAVIFDRSDKVPPPEPSDKNAVDVAVDSVMNSSDPVPAATVVDDAEHTLGISADIKLQLVEQFFEPFEMFQDVVRVLRPGSSTIPQSVTNVIEISSSTWEVFLFLISSICGSDSIDISPVRESMAAITLKASSTESDRVPLKQDTVKRTKKYSKISRSSVSATFAGERCAPVTSETIDPDTSSGAVKHDTASQTSAVDVPSTKLDLAKKPIYMPSLCISDELDPMRDNIDCVEASEFDTGLSNVAARAIESTLSAPIVVESSPLLADALYKPVKFAAKTDDLSLVCAEMLLPSDTNNVLPDDVMAFESTAVGIEDEAMDWEYGPTDKSGSVKLESSKLGGLGYLKWFKPVQPDQATSMTTASIRNGVKGWQDNDIRVPSTMAQCGDVSCDIMNDSIRHFNLSSIAWISCDYCVLCHSTAASSEKLGTNSCLEGRIISLPCSSIANVGAHVNCLLWSSGVLESVDGVLQGSASAIRRGTYTICSYCGEKGATVGCEVRWCKLVYHLRCAVSAGCTLVDVSVQDSEPDIKGHRKAGRKKKLSACEDPLAAVESGEIAPASSEINGTGAFSVKARPAHLMTGTRRTVTFCAEHTQPLQMLGWNVSERYEPKEPLREITIGMEEWLSFFIATASLPPGVSSKANAAMPESPVVGELVPRLLLDRRACIRVGALTVHNIGNIVLNSPWFHLPDLIYPLGFESTRLFWSYKTPGQRTIYRFDILSSTCHYFNEEYRIALGALNSDTYPFNRAEGAENGPNDAESDHSVGDSIVPSSFPVFRVVAMDDQDNPYLALTVEECYTWMRTVIKKAVMVKSEDDSAGVPSRVGQLDFVLSIKLNAPRRARKLGTCNDSVSAIPLKDVRSKSLMFFGLGLSIVRYAIELNRDSVITMLPSLCFPHTRYLSDAAVFERNETLQNLRHDFGLGINAITGKIAKVDQIPAYKPRFLLPERLPTVEVLRRLVTLRKEEQSALQSRHGNSKYGESCSRSRGFCGKRYCGDVDDEKSDFSALTAAAAQLLSIDRTRSSVKNRGRSLVKRAAEDESAGIFEMLSSPGASGNTEFLSEPGGLNMSAERLQAKLEYDYWVMHDNNISEVEKHLAVQRSGIHGYGIYAQRDFTPNSMIVEYVGEQIRHTLADLREIEYERQSGLSGSCYLFRLDKDLVVDATHVGGMARFLNHCCEPSCYAYVVSTGKQRPNYSTSAMMSPGGGVLDSSIGEQLDEPRVEQKHIVIMAGRYIKTGEEITYDYKFPIEEGEKLTCFCGAVFCRGSMN